MRPAWLLYVRRLLGCRKAIRLSALALITVVLTAVAGCQSSQQSAPSSKPCPRGSTSHNTAQVGLPSSSPSQLTHKAQTPHELPFTGLGWPMGVAVDTAGNVYVVDCGGGSERVLELPAGSTTQVELPFTGLIHPFGVAVDTAGNVYVTDTGRVLKLPAGSTTQVELPFTGLIHPFGVAVDTAGNVYVTDYRSGNDRVLKLSAGSTTQVELPFTGLLGYAGVAVDTAGNVYVTDTAGERVLKLSAGSTSPFELPFFGLKTVNAGVAVDTAGNVYVTGSPSDPYTAVWKLLAPSDTPVELAFNGGNGAKWVWIAVDTAGNAYITDQNNRVVKLPPG
jgi:serine/threonine protein kinase, bacterial